MDYVVDVVILNNFLVPALLGDVKDVELANSFLLWLLHITGKNVFWSTSTPIFPSLLYFE